MNVTISLKRKDVKTKIFVSRVEKNVEKVFCKKKKHTQLVVSTQKKTEIFFCFSRLFFPHTNIPTALARLVEIQVVVHSW